MLVFVFALIAVIAHVFLGEVCLVLACLSELAAGTIVSGVWERMREQPAAHARTAAIRLGGLRRFWLRGRLSLIHI